MPEFYRPIPEEVTRMREASRKEYIYTTTKPVRLSELFDQGRYDALVRDRMRGDLCAELADNTVTVSALHSPSTDGATFIMYGRSIYSPNIASLLGIATKEGDIRGEEILSDWSGIYDIDLKELPIKEAGRDALYVPLWEQFNGSWHQILRTMYDDEKYGKAYNVDLKPVLCWTKNKDKRQIELGPLPMEMRKDVLDANGVSTDSIAYTAGEMNSALGLAYLAAFSPENSQWGEDVSASMSVLTAHRLLARAQNKLGSVRNSQNLQKSPLLPAMERFVLRRKKTTVAT